MLLLGVSFLFYLGAAADPPPNIVVVLTDDQGWGDTSWNCDNSTGMCAHTPHLDALAMSPHTALFHRWYSQGVCSPTRASILTGRSNYRGCIFSALPCDQENVADTCAMGKGGALPWSEFTIAKAAKASTLGDYVTIQLGKWHLGDLWDKHLPDMNPRWPVSGPSEAGFDTWITTQAEASSSMTNCGCFPVNHSTPGPKPPSGYAKISPHGDQCVVGGGFKSDWCYPCTNYFYPNASDERQVHQLTEKILGDDSEFLLDHFEKFLVERASDQRPFLAHLCLHSIHEPHPAMPEYYDMYPVDPDYLGTLTQLDVQIGRLLAMLKTYNIDDHTVVFFTSDNGPHQGAERTDIQFSTNHLRQCKASAFEGGIRVPGLMHAPHLISKHKNISTPVACYDVLPTIMELLQVNTTNPTWAMDGVSLLPLLEERPTKRAKPFGLFWTGQWAVIDDDIKLMSRPIAGQCTFQEPYASMSPLDSHYLFNITDDYHELHDLKNTHPELYKDMLAKLQTIQNSIAFSQVNETMCKNATSSFEGMYA